MLTLVYILELINRAMPLRVPWGMSIDFVAVPILLIFFILGIKYGIISSLGMLLILTIIGYGGIIGAIMKTSTTISMIVVLAVFLPWIKSEFSYKSRIKYSLAAILALLTRCGVACLLNYYFALPLFFKMPIEQLIELFFFGSIYGFIAYVSLMNITQGIVDLVLSWITVFEIVRRIIRV
ncbi:MAG: hypothetical protein NZ922_04645 [Candidatus Methanomethyliaceae archaeon]|nr:hypothetical protein [Candidatus Methanomethyliaceae archaeon]